jgi:hypothetical protein
VYGSVLKHLSGLQEALGFISRKEKVRDVNSARKIKSWVHPEG